MQVFICIIFFFYGRSLSDTDDLDALLLYENQQDLQVQKENENFLTLKRNIHQDIKEFKDFSFCFRINFLSFTDNVVSVPIHLQTDKFVKVVNPSTGQTFFRTNFIAACFGGWNSLSMHTFHEFQYEVIAENGVYVLWPEYEGGSLNANQWHSICFGFDVKTRIIYMVQNGITLINITQPEIWASKNRGYDTTMIGPVQSKEGPRLSQWYGFKIGRNTKPMSGYITDIHIYGETLSVKEMHDITSCKLDKKGDMYSWNANDWEPFDKELQKKKDTAVQYRKVSIPRELLCKTTEKYTFFPDTYGFHDGVDVCRRFGGKLVDVSTSTKVNAVVTFLGKNIKENPKYDETISISTYTMYTDEKEFNVWRHRETDELPSDPLIWNVGEPNGGMVENCA